MKNNSIGTGAFLIVGGMLLRRFLPTIGLMNIDTGVIGEMSIYNLLVGLGLLAIGLEVFNMSR